ncbi:putative Quinic acid utilization activator [Glarea lozoyensis 74030]|uniref:Putative Quinic acid utilization activator n=1 Tax=Glarea lozoyensis (strain ATCC 74030 / MF5533) TaxID=1104152 RepID=H0EJF8_GLAL7|nr:putative Quinic acid utilization activator [Glarea lozoyensis 74030]
MDQKSPPIEEEDGLKGKKSKQGPRKRVSQACDKCRSRKDKCDGAKPACSTCVANGRACSYDANVKKRGLPEGYVRGLEKLWGLAIRDVDKIEDNMLEAITRKNGDQQDWNDEAGSESLVKLWRKSQLSQELERVLSSIETVAESGKRKRVICSVYKLTLLI